MVKTKLLLTRTTAIVSVAALASAALLPALLLGHVKAGLPVDRKITMSSSAGGATDVIYKLGYTTATTGAQDLYGLVIEFCDSTPIIGDSSCTAPAGFNVNKATVSVAATGTGMGTFAVNGASTANTLMLTSANNTAIASGTPITVTLGTGSSDGVTNPDLGNHTFYARVLSYTTAGGATGYTSVAPGTYTDAGGIALSTANQLQITAKVQERLAFCVYVGGSCTADTVGAARTSAFTLGNTNGVLDPAGPFVDKTSHFDISTNALSGASVVMKGDVPVTGAFSITSSANSGMGATGNTAYASAATTEQFGFCAEQTTGSGLTFSAPYNNGACNTTTQTSGTGATGGAGTANFGFDRSTATTATGSTVAQKAAGNLSSATLSFIGNIDNVTEAGIYQTTLTYIATGQY